MIYGGGPSHYYACRPVSELSDLMQGNITRALELEYLYLGLIFQSYSI